MIYAYHIAETPNAQNHPYIGCIFRGSNILMYDRCLTKGEREHFHLVELPESPMEGDPALANQIPFGRFD